jgi:hypothetical protein
LHGSSTFFFEILNFFIFGKASATFGGFGGAETSLEIGQSQAVSNGWANEQSSIWTTKTRKEIVVTIPPRKCVKL